MTAKTHYRELTIDASRLLESDDAQRTAPAVVSTEYPVARDGYREILSHAPGAVDLSRAPLPLIESHDGRKLNVGVVEDLHVTGRKLRGTIRLGNSARAREIWSDIKAGVIRSLSIGYQWLEYVERGKDVIVQRFMPYEVSIVAIPADPGAGIYRSYQMTTETNSTETTTEREPTIAETMTRSQRRQESALAREERERVRAIFGIFEHGGLNEPEHIQARNRLIEENASVEIARQYTAPIRHARIQPVPSVAYAPGAAPTDRIRPVGRHHADSLRHFPGEHSRDKEESAYTAGQWVRGCLFNDSKARAWLGQRAMGISSSAGGSVLVPDAMASAIISLAEEFGVARQHARIWPMASDTLAIPRRTSGVSGFYVGENAEFTETAMTLDNINLVARKFAVLVRFSSELAEDSVIDIASLLAEECGRAFAEAEDSALFNGDGTSVYGGMVGVLGQIVSTAGAVDATTAHDTFEEIDAADLARTMAALPSYARKGAKWFASPEANDLVFQRLAAAAGGATMIERAGTYISAYAGHEIVIADKMPVTVTALNNLPMLLFGNMSQAAAFGLRREIRIRTDESRFAEYDQLALFASQRFDIVVHDVGSPTAAGPLVALVGNT